MNCTKQNTVFYSAASYPVDCYKHIRQFIVSARKFGYPIHFLNFKNDWIDWWHAKYMSLLEYEAKYRRSGVEYFCWCDACDTVFVRPIEEFLEIANTLNLPRTSLLTTTDWYWPYSYGNANPDPAFVLTGWQSHQGVLGYPCAGLIFGHIDAFKTVISELSRIKAQSIDQFNQATKDALAQSCDQTLMHIYRMQAPEMIMPDINCYLLSNYIHDSTVGNVKLEEMRRYKTKDKQHLYIGDACIIHGSPSFRLGAPLENFIDTIL